MAAQRPPAFTATTSHLSPYTLDASNLRLDDNASSARRRQSPRERVPDDPPDEPVYPYATVERQWTNFYTEDGVRLYRPSEAELKQIRHDPRDGADVLFADDEPWLSPEVEIYPPANQRVVMPSRGRSPTRRGPPAPARDPEEDEWSEHSSDSGSDDGQDDDPGAYLQGMPGSSGHMPGRSAGHSSSQNTVVNRQHYPAYDGASHRIGMEHVRYPSGPPPAAQGHSGSYYRPKTQHYPTGSPEPRVLSVDLDLVDRARASRRKLKGKDVSMDTASPMILDRGEMESRFIPPGQVSSPDELPDAGPFIRELLGLSPDVELNLECLRPPPPGQKPNYPYPVLVQLAIYGSPEKRLTLSEIYATLEQKYEWFRNSPEKTKWQGSIRHNLSLNKIFRKIARPMSYPGKGDWWVVDYSNGEGNKRERKRNRLSKKAMLLIEKESEEEASDEGSTTKRGYKAIPGAGRFRTLPPAPGHTASPAAEVLSPAINPMFVVPSPSPSMSSPNMPSPSMSAHSRPGSGAGIGTNTGTRSRGSRNTARTSVQQFSTIDDADPAHRSPASHAVTAGRTTGRSASRQNSSPYSAPVPIRRSARLRGHEPRELSRSQSPAAADVAMNVDVNSGSGAHSVFGQSSFGGTGAQIAPNNALGLGFGVAPGPAPAAEADPSYSHASASPPVRRSTRRVIDTSQVLPTAFNGGRRTYTGKEPYRERRRRGESEDEYD